MTRSITFSDGAHRYLITEDVDGAEQGPGAYAVASSTLQKSGSLKPGTNTATSKGAKRGRMTEAQRAKTR